MEEIGIKSRLIHELSLGLRPRLPKASSKDLSQHAKYSDYFASNVAEYIHNAVNFALLFSDSSPLKAYILFPQFQPKHSNVKWPYSQCKRNILV